MFKDSVSRLILIVVGMNAILFEVHTCKNELCKCLLKKDTLITIKGGFLENDYLISADKSDFQRNLPVNFSITYFF